MEGKNHTVISEGITLENKNPETVKKNVAKIFKTDVAKVECFFSGHPRVIRKNLSLPEAQKYKEIIQKTGLSCRIVSEGASRPCPKCGYRIPPGDTASAGECPKCGIIIDKYKEKQQEEAENNSHEPHEISGKKENYVKKSSGFSLKQFVFFSVLLVLLIFKIYTQFFSDGESPENSGKLLPENLQEISRIMKKIQKAAPGSPTAPPDDETLENQLSAANDLLKNFSTEKQTEAFLAALFQKSRLLYDYGYRLRVAAQDKSEYHINRIYDDMSADIPEWKVIRITGDTGSGAVQEIISRTAFSLSWKLWWQASNYLLLADAAMITPGYMIADKDSCRAFRENFDKEVMKQIVQHVKKSKGSDPAGMSQGVPIYWGSIKPVAYLGFLQEDKVLLLIAYEMNKMIILGLEKYQKSFWSVEKQSIPGWKIEKWSERKGRFPLTGEDYTIMDGIQISLFE